MYENKLGLVVQDVARWFHERIVQHFAVLTENTHTSKFVTFRGNHLMFSNGICLPPFRNQPRIAGL